MALKSTVFKFGLSISDMDRGHYGEHALTVARHPSENDERMMIRVLAFALFADDDLRFGRGLSSDDEADLHATDPDGTIRLWIDVGLPDEKLVKKAAARARQVVVIAYGRTAGLWWGRVRDTLERLDNLTVWQVDADDSRALATLASRGNSLQFIRQDGHLWLGSADPLLEPRCQLLKNSGKLD